MTAFHFLWLFPPYPLLLHHRLKYLCRPECCVFPDRVLPYQLKAYSPENSEDTEIQVIPPEPLWLQIKLALYLFILAETSPANKQTCIFLLFWTGTEMGPTCTNKAIWIVSPCGPQQRPLDTVGENEKQRPPGFKDKGFIELSHIQQQQKGLSVSSAKWMNTFSL